MADNENDKQNSTADSNKPIYKKPSFIIGLVVVLSVILISIKWYMGTLGYVTTDDAYIDAHRLELGSKILGRVVKLHFGEGDTVKTGQLVAELDSTDIIARLNQAKAVLNSAQASLELAKVNVEKSQIDFDRAKAQFKDNVVPKAEFDNAQKKLEAAQAEYKISESRIISSQADIKVIQSNLEHTKIYSTLTGVAAKKWVLIGDVVQPGQPIYSIYDTQNVWVTAQLEETNISSLALDDLVEINVDSYPDQVFKGKIFQIGTNTSAQFSLIPPSNASGNFTKVTQRIPVKISIQNDSGKPLKFGFLPGMSVEVKIKVAKNG